MTSLLGTLYSRKAELEKQMVGSRIMYSGINFEHGLLNAKKEELEQVIEQVEGIVKALEGKSSKPFDFRDHYFNKGLKVALDLLGKIGETPQICPKCRGTGKAGEEFGRNSLGNLRSCDECHGSGKVGEQKA